MTTIFLKRIENSDFRDKEQISFTVKALKFLFSKLSQQFVVSKRRQTQDLDFFWLLISANKVHPFFQWTKFSSNM